MVKGNRDEKARVIASEKSSDDGKFEMTALFDYETMTYRKLIGSIMIRIDTVDNDTL